MNWKAKYCIYRLKKIKYELSSKSNYKNFLKMVKDYDGLKKVSTLDWKISYYLFGAEPEDYFSMGFSEKHNLFYRNHHMTRERLNFIKPIFNSEKAISFLDSKDDFNLFYSKYLKREWCTPNSVTREEFDNMFSRCDKLFVKPLRGRGGKNAFVYNSKEENIDDLYTKLTGTEDEYIVEEYYCQKGILKDINPSSLNTVRITTIRSGEKVEPVAAYFRAGGKDSVVDNLHSGGIRYCVDVRNGMILEGNNYKEGHIKIHPSTNIEVYGKMIPNWDKAIAFAKELHLLAPKEANLIGWDICISDDELVLIEGNAGPGFPPEVDYKMNTWKKVRKLLDVF